MNLPAENKLKPSNFWELYKSEIAPRLREIDIFVKSMEECATVSEVACALSISEDEVLHIMNDYGISEINKKTFFVIMENGTSSICKLFKRECDMHSPFVYTKQDIAYIYGLDINLVNLACDQLGIAEATAYTLPLLFSHIPVV